MNATRRLGHQLRQGWTCQGSRGSCLSREQASALEHRRRHASSSISRSTTSSSKPLPQPRPDYALVLECPEEAARHLEARRTPTSLPIPQLIQSIRHLHEELQSLTHTVTQLRTERNALGRILANKSATAEERAEARARAEAVRNELMGSKGAPNAQPGLEDLLKDKEAALLELTSQLPNVSSPKTRVGGYEAIDIVKQTSLPSQVEKHLLQADHVSLLERLQWLAMPTHVTGSSWPYLMNGGALLEQALLQYALSEALKQGFEVMITPDVVRHEVMKRCGFNPRDSGGEAQTYFVTTTTSSNGSTEGDEAAQLALAATSEIPLAGYLASTTYKHPERELPKKLVAVGHAFRAEAGSRGKESRGLYRVHQFTKVELFVVTSGTEVGASERALDELVQLQWRILNGLKLPLRLLNMPTAELGGSAYQKYDIEAWMPGRGSWGELASASNCTDFQARRLGIRHATTGSANDHETSGDASSPVDEVKSLPKTAFAHTLNATAAAIPRLIVAIVENGAVFDETGNWVALELPGVLKRYWLGDPADHVLEALPDPSVKKQDKKSKSSSVEIRWKD